MAAAGKGGEKSLSPARKESAMRHVFLFHAALIGISILAGPALGQYGGARPPSSSSGLANDYYGPYSVYGPGLTFNQSPDYYGPYSVYGPGLTFKQSQFSGNYARVGSVLVPDGGESLVARYGTVRQGRNEMGAPGLGKAPGLNRVMITGGFSSGIGGTSLSVRAIVLPMSSEELRQTGVRP